MYGKMDFDIAEKGWEKVVLVMQSHWNGNF